MGSYVAPLIGTAAVQGPTAKPDSDAQVATYNADGSFEGWVTPGSDIDLGPMTIDADNDRVGINNDTPGHALDVNGTARFAGPVPGQSIRVGHNSGIRVDRASNGILRIDASDALTGTIELRATTVQVQGVFEVFTITATGGVIEAAGGVNPRVTARGSNGVIGLNVIRETVGGERWEIAQNRSGPDGSLSIGIVSGVNNGTKMLLHADGTVVMPALPTSDPVIAGAIYNDGGTLKISGG